MARLHHAQGRQRPEASAHTRTADPDALCELTLWEQSLELRLILSELVGLVFFLDASDLTRDTVTFRLNFPHLSAGTGFRLRTPVGAARFDLGLRVPYMQQVGKPHLPDTEGDPDTIWGAPLAFHFGLGEAF